MIITTILRNANAPKEDNKVRFGDFVDLKSGYFVEEFALTKTEHHFWSNSIDNPARRVWAGLSFEQICIDHISQIKQKLGISGVLSEVTSWYTGEDEDKGINGAQIDLLIDRRDRVVSICEMKYSVNEFTIDKTYDMNLRNKMESFRKATNCKKSIQLVMVTTYGVKPGKYSGVVNAEVTLDDLFR